MFRPRNAVGMPTRTPSPKTPKIRRWPGIMDMSPTIELWVETYADVPNRGWRWSAYGVENPAAREYVYTANDLERVMFSYGYVLSQMLRYAGPSEFRVRAYTIVGWRTLATYEWAWNAELGRYKPTGEPWVVWDADATRISHGRHVA